MYSDVLKKVVTSNKNLEHICKILENNHNIECEVFDMNLINIVMNISDDIGVFIKVCKNPPIKELIKINEEIIKEVLPKLKVNKKANDMYLKQLNTTPWDKPMNLPMSSREKDDVVEFQGIVNLNYKPDLTDRTLIFKDQVGDERVRQRF